MSRRNSRAGKARRHAERQQRREGAGSTVRPGGRRSHVLDVELSRLHFLADEIGGECVTWFAEWGLRDDSTGVEDSNEDLQQLIDDLIEDAGQWTDRYDLTIEWELSGDAPPGKTVHDMAAEAGVTLPEAVIPSSVSSGRQGGADD